MTTGPFLYDDEPAPLHTGTPRRRNWLVMGLLLGTVLVAVGMVVSLYVVRGSPAEQSEESVGVFLAALANGDGETAHGLLCAEVRATVDEGEVPPEFEPALPATVVGSAEAEVDGASAVEVEVRGADGAVTTFVVLNEDGPHLCGASSGT
jgi:hypothetical protein